MRLFQQACTYWKLLQLCNCKIHCFNVVMNFLPVVAFFGAEVFSILNGFFNTGLSSLNPATPGGFLCEWLTIYPSANVRIYIRS